MINKIIERSSSFNNVAEIYSEEYLVEYKIKYTKELIEIFKQKVKHLDEVSINNYILKHFKTRNMKSNLIEWSLYEELRDNKEFLKLVLYETKFS